MPPNPPALGLVRSAAAVNALIRAVVVGARDREWTTAERTLYGLLLVEWEAARLADDEIVEAA